MTTIAVVHTGPVTIQPIKEQISEQIPEARVINIMDDSLLNDVRAAGHLTPEVASRIHSYMANAQAMQVDIILNACSSVGEAVDSVRNFVNTPIVKIDEAMAEEASSIGRRVGVVATVSTTLEPTVRLIKKKADDLGRPIEVTERIAEGAFEALLRGDGTGRRGRAGPSFNGATCTAVDGGSRAGAFQPEKRRCCFEARAW
jgi:hypothetical protein